MTFPTTVKITILTVSLPHINTLSTDSFLDYLITKFQLQGLHSFKSDHMLMNEEHLRVLKGASDGLCKGLIQNLYSDWKCHKNQMWGNHTELQTFKHYHYTMLPITFCYYGADHYTWKSATFTCNSPSCHNCPQSLDKRFIKTETYFLNIPLFLCACTCVCVHMGA
jgi:hypothetical protein